IAIAGKAWRGVSAQSDGAVVAGFLRRQLVQAVPAQPDASGLSGDSDRLEFLGPAPARSMPAGLYRHRLELRRDELWYAWAPLDGGTGHERRLLTGIGRLDIAYAGREGRWQSAWSDPARLPRLVRLRLVVAGEDWPELVAGPVVDWPVLDRP
ncbi:MAG TPA: hypothetical protein VLL76_01180, partial [Candidatus Omnitrophota bacterium]|nr:hypothetical protein [Candidatus Omnitrophota bacterium]